MCSPNVCWGRLAGTCQEMPNYAYLMEQQIALWQGNYEVFRGTLQGKNASLQTAHFIVTSFMYNYYWDFFVSKDQLWWSENCFMFSLFFTWNKICLIKITVIWLKCLYSFWWQILYYLPSCSAVGWVFRSNTPLTMKWLFALWFHFQSLLIVAFTWYLI